MAITPTTSSFQQNTNNKYMIYIPYLSHKSPSFLSFFYHFIYLQICSSSHLHLNHLTAHRLILPPLLLRLPAKFLPSPFSVVVRHHRTTTLSSFSPPQQHFNHRCNASRRVPSPHHHHRRIRPRRHPRLSRRQRPLRHDISLRRLRRQRLADQGRPRCLPSLRWTCSLQGTHEAVSLLPLCWPPTVMRLRPFRLLIQNSQHGPVRGSINYTRICTI